MQVPTKKHVAAGFWRAVKSEIPNQAGIDAWLAFLGAHASLMRRLDADLRARTGAGLNDFDVLAVLAGAGGSLHMTELAERAYISRSGMTRRVDHPGALSRALTKVTEATKYG